MARATIDLDVTNKGLGPRSAKHHIGGLMGTESCVELDGACVEKLALEDIVDLSLKSMDQARGLSLNFVHQEGEFLEDRFEPTVPITIQGEGLSLIPIEPSRESVRVVAIDTSSIAAGEAGSGSLYAIRGSLVWKEGGSFKYLRYGPLIFHIIDSLHECLFAEQGACAPESLTGKERVASKLRNSLELALWRIAASVFRNSLVLLDGSLMAGTQAAPLTEVTDVLRMARGAGNHVLAISKSTKLILASGAFSKLLMDMKRAFLVDIDPQVRRQLEAQNVRLLGHVYISKLNPQGLAFRLDVDAGLDEDERITAVRRLAGNEVLYQGYPETLRLAHIFATFTASEVLAIQRSVASKYGLQVNPKPDMRRWLFGPFGSGMEA